MEMLQDFGTLKALIAIAGAIWALRKWWMREEHFPRIALDVQARFIDVDPQRPLVLEIAATIENKGLVPLKVTRFGFSLRTLKKNSKWGRSKKHQRQLDFGDKPRKGIFVTKSMGYTFVSPGVRTEYTYVTVLDQDAELIRISANLFYPTRDETHHAARVFAVPKRATASLPVTTNGTVAASGAAPA